MPALQGSAAVTEKGSASATSLTGIMPSGIASGEVLLCHISDSFLADPTVVATPTGWQVARAPLKDPSGNGVWGAAYWRLATGSDPAPAFTGLSANRSTIVVQRYSDVHSSTPIDATVVTATKDAASGSSLTVGAVTTVTAGALLVAQVTTNASQTTTTVGAPAGMTPLPGTQATGSMSTGTGRFLSVATEPRPSAGSTGTRVWSLTGTSTVLQMVGISLALRPASSGGFAGSLTRSVVGTDRVSVRVSGVTSARLRVEPTGTTVTLTSTPGAAVAPNAQGDAHLPLPSGLAPGVYDFRVQMTDASGTALDSMSQPGRFRVWATGVPVSHTIGMASCQNADSPMLAHLATLNLDVFRHMGDLYYQDGSGTGIANFRTQMSAVLNGANMQALAARTPMMFKPDDHDGMANDATGGEGSSASEIAGWASYNQAFREMLPTVPSSGETIGTLGVYSEKLIGRVHHVNLDCKTFMTDPLLFTASGNTSKTILGATQKTWLTNLVSTSTASLFLVDVSFPYYDAPVNGDDTWGSYEADRTWLNSLFSTAGKQWVAVAGDMHACAYHDGTVNTANPGGVKVIQAGPLQQTSSAKGGTNNTGAGYTVGPWYEGTLGSTTRQAVTMSITDTGDQITLAPVFRRVNSSGVEIATLTVTPIVIDAPAATGVVNVVGTSYRIPDLLPSTRYRLRIVARNETGVGPESAPVAFVTLANNVPQVPRFVAASAETSQTVNVTWVPGGIPQIPEDVAAGALGPNQIEVIWTQGGY